LLALSFGLLFFFLPHLLRDLQSRNQFKQQRPHFKTSNGLFSAISIFGIILIIWGKSTATFYTVWVPPFDQRYVASLLMIPACIIAVSPLISRSYIRWKMKNPLLVSSMLWAAAHLWTNGDLSSILLFGSFFVWSLIKLLTLRLEKVNLAPGTFYLRRDLTVVVFGLTIYLTLFVCHGYLFGVGLATQ